jgi:ADP-ribose pyrophosphatase YjhB (NUDIX family)
VQQRDDILGIVHRGKIGRFDGHREGDETFLQCPLRELSEELRLSVRREHVQTFGTVEAFFVVRGVSAAALRVTEGPMIAQAPSLATAIEADALEDRDSYGHAQTYLSSVLLETTFGITWADAVA